MPGLEGFGCKAFAESWLDVEGRTVGLGWGPYPSVRERKVETSRLVRIVGAELGL